MTPDALAPEARAVGLAVRGAFHPEAADDAPEGCGTLVLLGPDEPDFWALFTGSDEYRDGLPDPMNRWSERVVGGLAADWGGSALFPFGGPPWRPFLRWATRAGTAHASPVGLLVHNSAGLFISYRGAVALPRRLDLPRPAASPCIDCPAPCLTACPVGALGAGHDYDVPACKAHLATPAGAECRNGCLVRRACPVSQGFGRRTEQSAFHMSAFLGTQPA